jgi:hypothetical protein
VADKKNRYTCKTCGGNIITVDLDEGTTPFMLGCRATHGCRGMMQSSCYRGVTGEPAFVWRKPTADEYRCASLGMKEHFDQGGLDIHPITTESINA